MIASVSPVIRTHQGSDLPAQTERLAAFVARPGTPLSWHPGWLTAFARGFGHDVYALEAVEDGKTSGLLSLAFVRSLLFGRYLVSLPYLNYGGAVADDPTTAARLVESATGLADRLRVRFLELRHAAPVEHPRLTARPHGKVHMRLRLPADPDALFKSLKDKVRNLIRKGRKNGLTVHWGGQELLPEFYAVFSETMRDLGTPVYGRAFFAAVLDAFPGRAELCVTRQAGLPAAAALLLHGWGVTEVPSAASPRRFNPSAANMLMYWHLLERAVRRGQRVFDFGRSSADGPTFRFKKQWGAEPEPAAWQYYVREGSAAAMRPDNPKYQRLIRVWQRLPVGLTRWIGPPIVRGIP